MAQDDDNPLRRWSRRKREAARNPETELDARDKPARPPESEKESDPEPDAELIAALPDIDKLTLQSDFTVFLQSGVPTELRNRALARLWRMDPVFANLDGLVEYGEDYRAQMMATAGQKIASLYRTGRGMISPQEALDELEQWAKQAGEGGPAAAGLETQPPSASVPDTIDAEPTTTPPALVDPSAALSGPPDSEPPDATRRGPGSDRPEQDAGRKIVDNSPAEESLEDVAGAASSALPKDVAGTLRKSGGAKAATRRWGRSL